MVIPSSGKPSEVVTPREAQAVESVRLQKRTDSLMLLSDFLRSPLFLANACKMCIGVHHLRCTLRRGRDGGNPATE